MQGVTFGRVPLRLWEELQVKIQLIPVRLILLLISVPFEWVHVNKVKCAHLNSSILLMVVVRLLK
jgi:hypothetical protein